MNWQKRLKGKIKTGELLSGHTTFKIGGPVKFFIRPADAEDLKLLLSSAKRDKIPILVIGAGSNILAGDKGLRAAVVKLDAPNFKKISFEGGKITAGSGASLSQLLIFAQRRGLSGAEFLAGIPGTIGGALAMNAGARGKDISGLVESVTVMDGRGRIKTLNRSKIKFSYRGCSLDKFIILSARLIFKEKNKSAIKKAIEENLSLRHKVQDFSRPNAGCVFKNPAGYSAGRLIDLCGLKGAKSGGAYVSGRHANFILNKGNARCRDVLRLMDLIKREVRKKFKVTLQPEIKIWQ